MIYDALNKMHIHITAAEIVADGKCYPSVVARIIEDWEPLEDEEKGPRNLRHETLVETTVK